MAVELVEIVNPNGRKGLVAATSDAARLYRQPPSAEDSTPSNVQVQLHADGGAAALAAFAAAEEKAAKKKAAADRAARRRAEKKAEAARAKAEAAEKAETDAATPPENPAPESPADQHDPSISTPPSQEDQS